MRILNNKLTVQKDGWSLHEGAVSKIVVKYGEFGAFVLVVSRCLPACDKEAGSKAKPMTMVKRTALRCFEIQDPVDRCEHMPESLERKRYPRS